MKTRTDKQKIRTDEEEAAKMYSTGYTKRIRKVKADKTIDIGV